MTEMDLTLNIADLDCLCFSLVRLGRFERVCLLLLLLFGNMRLIALATLFFHEVDSEGRLMTIFFINYVRELIGNDLIPSLLNALI